MQVTIGVRLGMIVYRPICILNLCRCSLLALAVSGDTDINEPSRWTSEGLSSLSFAKPDSIGMMFSIFLMSTWYYGKRSIIGGGIIIRMEVANTRRYDDHNSDCASFEQSTRQVQVTSPRNSSERHSDNTLAFSIDDDQGADVNIIYVDRTRLNGIVRYTYIVESKVS